MNATMLDGKRRLIMPPELKPGSAVRIQQLDANTWVVTCGKPLDLQTVVLLPDVKKLSRDPEWEEVESRITSSIDGK